MQTASEIKITAKWYELDGKKIGDRVTVTNCIPARVGSGMEGVGEVSGEIVQMDEEPTRCYGCSSTWRGVTLRV